MAKDRRFIYCDFDVCDKQLHEFCFRSTFDDKLYCDEICAARSLQETTQKLLRWQ